MVPHFTSCRTTSWLLVWTSSGVPAAGVVDTGPVAGTGAAANAGEANPLAVAATAAAITPARPGPRRELRNRMEILLCGGELGDAYAGDEQCLRGGLSLCTGGSRHG